MEDVEDKALGKREARKQDRRDAILAIAKRSFLEKGYAATSMSSIAAELGGSKATLWSYFPSKVELFTAMLDHATTSYREELAELLIPSADLRETITRFCRAFLTKITSDDGLSLHRLIVAEATRFPEIGSIFANRGPVPTQQLLAAFLGEQMDQGRLRRDDPFRASRAVTSLCLGGVHQRLLWGMRDKSLVDIEAEAKNAADLFLRAFAPETGNTAA